MAAKDTLQITPAHVAIIMDGNGRWATRRGLPRIQGHRIGARRVREIVEACPDLGVTHLTLFAFSTENWKRTEGEVSGLMGIFRRYIQSEAKDLIANGVRVRFIGDRSRLDPKLTRLMDTLERETCPNATLNLTVALNYGARDELARATARLAQDLAAGKVAADALAPDSIRAYLDTGFAPDPDLVIRTSGEQRISNFLLWQSAYAEYAFTQTLWPDFTAQEFSDIVLSYATRERRFGTVSP
ncbi:polyprenyl diphosphate synthase [Qingshengfaniella alkalisoli]|uniref:Isoprenyl transferase n=1 Tax=Qingshengfaniella alkalisoli TaxID=2599296 RepID=A0A5B8I6V3_9RHOB|nr:polyprenyl diphosphate synthase [Qingshengfaniella alkalisoli]QDY69335.1 di-trans,poly-cis-decaprenylcistransferase [Qingshengfaniella alkalisoli]